MSVRAQTPASPPPPPAQGAPACDGCPPRSVGKSLFQTTIVNVFYGLANLARGQVTAEITPKTWWANMHHGWVWDLDDFVVNQIGHPYQGNNYFNSGRANGLSFYESAAVAAFGSATWEYFGETNKPSLNDFINTTLGGIALGEMFHRAAWLVRDTRASGGKRLMKEIMAAALDPVTGANRFITGDSDRLTDKPADMVPMSLTGLGSFGVLWRGSEATGKSSTDPFLETDLGYGDVNAGRSRVPYDAFSVRLRFGGGSAFSEAKVRGRLAGQSFRNGRVHFGVVQTYDFQSNDAYSTGSQSFEAAVGGTTGFIFGTKLRMLTWGGLTVLGAIDSLPAGVTERPEEEEPTDPGNQGVSEGPRHYDYGPGTDFGASGHIMHGDRIVGVLFYEGRQLYSVDGIRANHFLQRARADLMLPLHGPLGIGVSAEYFDRRTFYQDEARTVSRFHYPQARVFATWSIK